MSPGVRLEVVADPEREADFEEDVAARRKAAGILRKRGVQEEQIFPAAVEESLPCPVEVHREAQQRTLQSDAVRTAAVDKAGMHYIGTVTIHPEKVTIDGDKATFEGCQDGSKAYVVKKGEKAAGVGSRSVGTSQLTVSGVLANPTGGAIPAQFVPATVVVR